jgi:hypothetical protein
MKEAVIGSLIALALASPSTAQSFDLKIRQGIVDCHRAIRDSQRYPGTIRWLGHSAYFVEEGSAEIFIRVGFKVKEESGHMHTATTDCILEENQR